LAINEDIRLTRALQNDKSYTVIALVATCIGLH